jgi:hypothetical protein
LVSRRVLRLARKSRQCSGSTPTGQNQTSLPDGEEALASEPMMVPNGLGAALAGVCGLSGRGASAAGVPLWQGLTVYIGLVPARCCCPRNRLVISDWIARLTVRSPSPVLRARVVADGQQCPSSLAQSASASKTSFSIGGSDRPHTADITRILTPATPTQQCWTAVPAVSQHRRAHRR